MKTIVALVDFSGLAYQVLELAGKLALAFNSKVILMHMVAKEPVIVDAGLISPVIMREPSQESMQKHDALLMKMCGSLIQSGVRASVQQLQGEDMDAMLAETEKCHADLIIIGSHQHSTIYDLVVGSVTNDVLRRAHCPVLVVPGHAKASDQEESTS